MHGRTLISTGLADLDAILEGGVPLGSVVLILQVEYGSNFQL